MRTTRSQHGAVLGMVVPAKCLGPVQLCSSLVWASLDVDIRISPGLHGGPWEVLLPPLLCTHTLGRDKHRESWEGGWDPRERDPSLWEGSKGRLGLAEFHIPSE